MTSEPENLEPALTLHIFTVSAAMVGVCLTGIGLFRAYIREASTPKLGDDFLALDASIFAVVCCLSFLSFRSRSPRLRQRLRLVADWLFLSGLAVMVGVCLLLTYDLF